MIHTASLVHDDVLDESNTRRGEICLQITTDLTHKIASKSSSGVQTSYIFVHSA